MKPETKKLKYLMAANGWNQQEVAQELGVTQATISRLLNELITMHGSMKVLIDFKGRNGKET